MTRDELNNAWERRMHRLDMTGDLDLVFDLTAQRIVESLMFTGADPVEILDKAPRMFLHGGLLYLHEIAQDDAGAQREAAFFDGAREDYTFARALGAGTPQMEAPYGT